LTLASIVFAAAACSSRQLDWIHQESGTTASLRGVSAIDANVAWASGSSGTVLRTIDGGASWKSVTVKGLENLDYRDVHALDAKRAWILSAGLPAVICYTADGGESWTTQYRNDTEGAFFDAIDFWDEKHGIAFSDPVDGKFLIVVTGDGGRSWQEIPRDALPAPLPGEAGFAGSGTCLRICGRTSVRIGTGGGGARILTSHDRGRTWTVTTTEIGHSASAGIFSLAFADDQRGVAVGGDYKNENGSESTAAWTDDGGITWRTPSESPPSGFRSAVTRVVGTSDEYLAVGPSGIDVSTNGGRTWKRVGKTGYHAISCTAGACWVVGSEGRIAKRSQPARP
jgi:photosystem II stability/assembly factor-like uncharacterized protein